MKPDISVIHRARKPEDRPNRLGHHQAQEVIRLVEEARRRNCRVSFGFAENGDIRPAFVTIEIQSAVGV